MKTMTFNAHNVVGKLTINGTLNRIPGVHFARIWHSGKAQQVLQFDTAESAYQFFAHEARYSAAMDHDGNGYALETPRNPIAPTVETTLEVPSIGGVKWEGWD